MSSAVSITLVQQPFVVAAVAQNTAKVLEIATSSQSDLLLFPELTLTGYPPEDLLLRGDFQLLVEQSLQQICAAKLPNTLVIGHPWRDGEALYNAASVIQNGEVIARYYKQALPNHGVFDEKRYFTEGTDACSFELKGQRFAVLICEDVWQGSPAALAKEQGADWALVLNASPYEIGKATRREELLQTLAKHLHLGFVYVNNVIGQDELVFDGQSLVVSPDAQLLFRGKACEPELATVNLAARGQHYGHIELAPRLSVEAEVYAALVMATRDYIQHNGFPGAVLGLSGGIDSALTLAIAADAIGADKVQALMLPFAYTSSMSVEDAKAQAEVMGVEFDSVSIEPMYNSFMQQLTPLFNGRAKDTTEENLQARIRGVLLMAMSNKTGRMLLTTGNKSENAVGYCTLYGDMCGGFAVIKDVPKTLVYRLSEYRNSISPVIPQRVIDRPPSAELAPDQTDQDNLPPYDDLDAMIEAYVEHDKSLPEIVAMGYDETTVRRVLNLIDINEYKRRQSAVGPKVTSRNFGKDRRYPITSWMRKQR
ncbi:NAD+ synthase [Rheinheimera sp. 1928-s]|uniref:NAD+ synthase n=1 Tax=Rheinheimera sp. 1928-s TaxID=3033803 RepID=UPI002601E298|nr:NAD+ synthase [Rheinheimera sp. 1928-s]MDF3124453.1 NAD+ synthase [Rheinheimera sp. 1928-s]